MSGFIQRIEQLLDHRPQDVARAAAALTHPSFLHQHPDAGAHNQRLEFLGDAVLGLMAGGVGLYDASTPMQIEIERMVAVGDRVCVELVLEARTARGEDYRNHYHFAFRLRDGRICAVREYVDTLYAQRKLFD